MDHACLIFKFQNDIYFCFVPIEPVCIEEIFDELSINSNQIICVTNRREALVLFSWDIIAEEGDYIYIEDEKFSSIIKKNIDDAKNITEERFDSLYSHYEYLYSSSKFKYYDRDRNYKRSNK
jgi:hypothetical protein